MRVLKLITRTTILGCAVSMLPAAALAGGWSTEGIADYDLLFAEERFAFEAQAVYGARNVDFENAKTTLPTSGGPQDATGSSAAEDMAPNVLFASGAVKFSLTNDIDLFARVNQPYFIREQPGFDWNGQFAIGETNADALGIDALLSYRHEISGGKYLRVFGGVRSVTVDYEQLSTPSYNGTELLGQQNKIDVGSSQEYGYRIGAAYEVPEIALRAMIAYESAIDVDLDGTLTTPLIPGGPQGASASATLPQSVEAKIQSGVAPGWLATLGVKWTDWSVLDQLAVDVDNGVKIERDLGYSDGWIVEAGIGHKLTEKLSLGGNIGWDKGIGGPYSDLYYIGLGGSYDLTENLQFSLGGRAVYKTSGEGIYKIANSATGTVNSNYEYDSSWNFALSSKIRVAF